MTKEIQIPHPIKCHQTSKTKKSSSVCDVKQQKEPKSQQELFLNKVTLFCGNVHIQVILALGGQFSQRWKGREHNQLWSITGH